MKVLGINGSPRLGGNTDTVLEEALEGARSAGASTEKIILDTLSFSACRECEDLKDDGSCIVDDDMQIVYRKIEEAGSLIVASPIFFGSVSAQTKMMIDRFQCLWRAKYVLKKDLFRRKRKGAFIAVGAKARKEFFENARAIVRHLFAVVNIEYADELFCPGLESKGDALKDSGCLNRAYELGRKLGGI